MIQPPQHTHSFIAAPDFQPQLQVGATVAVVGTYITVSRPNGPEFDYCTVLQPPCPLPKFPADPEPKRGYAGNPLTIIGYDDGPAEGQFGRFVDGNFQAVGEGCPVDQVTHYKCPMTPGTVSLTVTADDPPHAVGDPPAYTVDDGGGPNTSPAVPVTVWDIIQPVRPGVPPPPHPAKVMIVGLPEAQNPPKAELNTEASVAATWGCMPQLFIMQWQTAGATTTNKLTITVDYMYPHLPESNTAFGAKSLMATYEGTQVQRQFHLFFARFDENHPESGTEWGGHYRCVDNFDRLTPNWYFYWTQVAPIRRDHAFVLTPIPRLPEGFILGGSYDLGTKTDFYWIYPGAQERFREYSSLKSPELEGIDQFGRICEHEQTHADHDIGNRTIENRSLGGPWSQDGDTDHDGILDLNEKLSAGGQTQPNRLLRADGTAFDTRVGVADNDMDGVPDGEEYAVYWANRRWQAGNQNVFSNDWAHPGKQWP